MPFQKGWHSFEEARVPLHSTVRWKAAWRGKRFVLEQPTTGSRLTSGRETGKMCAAIADS